MIVRSPAEAGAQACRALPFESWTPAFAGEQ
jgi:hypothetical protein